MTSNSLMLVVTCNPEQPVLTSKVLHDLGGDFHILAEGIAAERPADFEEARALRQDFAHLPLDINIVPTTNRRKKLLLADMDSTILTGETLDELAAYAGLQDTIAAITQRAMNGEISFKDALYERVAMLKGLPITAIAQTLKQMRYSQGAQTLIKTMKAHGAFTALASGGFTPFTQAVAHELGFGEQRANTLHSEDGTLTGTVAEPIFDRVGKLVYLKELVARLGISLDDTLTVGDGANDLDMLHAAGLGVGFHPKPKVRDEIPTLIVHSDLTALLYLQGYTRKDIAAVG